VVLPSSHSSSQSMTPLPTSSIVQWAEQPSQSAVLPSSHCSPGSRWPSPQRGVRWLGVQGPVMKAAQPLQVRKEPPGDVQVTSPSHTSPGPTMPSPHTDAGGRVVVVVAAVVSGATNCTTLRLNRIAAAAKLPSSVALVPARRMAEGAQTVAPSEPLREMRRSEPATKTCSWPAVTPEPGSGPTGAAVLAVRLPRTETGDCPREATGPP